MALDGLARFFRRFREASPSATGGTTNEADDITDATRRIFADLGEPQQIILAGERDWRGPLWTALEKAGLTHAWVPEALGGAGLSVAGTFSILRVAGAHAVAVPLAETLLAAWLLAEADLAPPGGALSVAAGGDLAFDAGGRLGGSATAVPFAREAGHLVVLAGSTVALLRREDAGVVPFDGLAGEPRDAVRFAGATPLARAEVQLTAGAVRRMGAAIRAMQMAGAIQAMLDMTTEYAQRRVAFGRPIGNFQALQHLLARLAEEAAAALAAATSATYAIGTLGIDGEATFVEVAAAKIRAGEAASEAAMMAHQVHGAIGFTDEHPLHRYVQRLWQWRDDFGSEAEWAVELGRLFAAKGRDGFWPTMTAI